ncbi:MAG: Rieske 2Fe-2S domain-containing protein [Pseudomonadota bacterium]
MSVAYIPVQWNPNKWFYDAVLVLMCGLYIGLFLHYAPQFQDVTRPVDTAVHRARALGSCAFFMLTVILCIGPLARLDRRFLPLLYNRRHFGVLTCFVALGHAGFILDWYFAFSPVPQWNALLSSNVSYGQVLGFPFEAFGIFALFVLIVLAATSHDFWLSFLTAPVWKALHYLIYFAYAAVVAHVTFGVMQDLQNPLFGMAVALSAALVSGLHLWAALAEPRPETEAREGHWERVGLVAEIEEGCAKIGLLTTGERVAVFKHEGTLSAISNACAHQNGPLGEGRIVFGCVTCPWHGFQYQLRNGRSPDPFTETVPTYHLKVESGEIWVDNRPNPPGTDVEPIVIDPAAAAVKEAAHEDA